MNYVVCVYILIYIYILIDHFRTGPHIICWSYIFSIPVLFGYDKSEWKKTRSTLWISMVIFMMIPHMSSLVGVFKHCLFSQWIGSRENLQETIDFPIKYGAFL